MRILGAHPTSPRDLPVSPPAIQPVIRTEKTLFLDRFGAPLPVHRCFKCNCSAQHEVRKTFASTGGFWRYILLLQPLLLPILLPIFIIRQQRVSVAFGLCDQCLERRRLGIALGACLILLSVPFFVYAILTLASIGPVSAVGGAIVLGAGLLTIAWSRHLADPKHVDDRWLVLRGGGSPFLAEIPQAPRPLN